MENWSVPMLIRNLKDEISALEEFDKLLSDDIYPWVFSFSRYMAQKAKELASQLALIQDGALPLKVAFVGDFSAGKSSFINHMLQDGLICPASVNPTTSVVTEFVYGQKEKITLNAPQKKQRKITRSEYARQVQAQPKDSTENQTIRFQFELPNKMLVGLHLFDTPGFNNAKNCSDSSVTESIIKEADAFFYLVDAAKGDISQSEIKTLEKIKSHSPKSTIRLVITKADEKPPFAIKKIKESISQKHGALFQPPILAYSIKEEKREEINTRQDLMALFEDLRNHSSAMNRASLVRDIRQHFDDRLLKGTAAIGSLQISVKQREHKIDYFNENLKKSIQHLHSLDKDHRSKILEMLEVAYESCFQVWEMRGTGWIWNKCRIVYNSEKLIRCLKTHLFNSDFKHEISRIFQNLFGNNTYLTQSLSEDIEKIFTPDTIGIRLQCIIARFPYANNEYGYVSDVYVNKEYNYTSEAHADLKCIHRYYSSHIKPEIEEFLRCKLYAIENLFCTHHSNIINKEKKNACELQALVEKLIKAYDKGNTFT